jgi:hypothetical protein
MRNKKYLLYFVVVPLIAAFAALIIFNSTRQEENTKLSAEFTVLQPFNGLVFDSEISTKHYASLDGIMCYVGPAIVEAMEDDKITKSEYKSIWALYRGDEKKKKNLIETVEECRRNQIKEDE